VVRRLRSTLVPYLLILPGGLWLVVFFAAPLIFLISMSTQSGDVVSGFTQTFDWHNYVTGFSDYHSQFTRSLLYGGLATVLCIMLSYPTAYWIAFRGGARKSTYLFLILLPFFVSFVLRTISWQYILGDNGLVLEPLKSLGLLPQNFRVLATSTAVVGGLTYNYLPFMVLPIYVALERIDFRVVEAAYDLYASRVQAFTKVILPLSLPGVFAGVLLNFVPAASDYVNAEVLGGPNNTMIGNIIQDEFLNLQNYPIGAALSFTLMAILLIGIFIYAKALGTDQVLEAGAS
jgi:spermidine/putrescine transport system permease protein